MGEPARKEDAHPFSLSINAVLLAEALAKSVCEKRSGIEIWQHALLECDGGTLKITTTDATRTLSLALECSGAIGAVTADVAQLRGALTGLTDDVKIETVGERLRLSQGRRRYHINTLPPAGFPLPPDENAETCQADSVRLGEALSEALYCVQRDHPDMLLRGVCVDNDHVVATDRNRVVVVPLARHAGVQFIIPRDSVALVAEHCERNGDVYLTRPAADAPYSQLVVSTTRATVRTLLIAGKFIDWRRIQAPEPSAMPHKADFDADAMIAAVQRITPFMWDGSKEIRSVRLCCHKGRIAVSPFFQTDTVDEVPCDASPDEFTCAVQSGYLIDILRAARGKRVTWGSNGDSTPQTFKAADSSTLHIVATVR